MTAVPHLPIWLLSYPVCIWLLSTTHCTDLLPYPLYMTAVPHLHIWLLSYPLCIWLLPTTHCTDLLPYPLYMAAVPFSLYMTNWNILRMTTVSFPPYSLVLVMCNRFQKWSWCFENFIIRKGFPVMAELLHSLGVFQTKSLWKKKHGLDKKCVHW